MNEKARVLIAEGRAPLSLRWKGIVEKAGFEAVVAYSGQVALSQARLIHPDLLLLSDHIGPPGPSETARRIKEDPATESIPIVILATTEESEALAASYPVEACLPVTTDPDQLIKAIRLLAGRGTRRSRNGQPVGLEGTLQGNLLPELLEFLFVTKKTGRVEVSDGERKGSIYIEGGNVLHAEFDGARGQDAFNQLCFLGRGYFKFEQGVRASETTMLRAGVALLLEAAKQLDDRRRARDTDPGRPAPAFKARTQVNGSEPAPLLVSALAETPTPPRPRAPAPLGEPELDLEPLLRTKTELAAPVPGATPATKLKPEPLAVSTPPGSVTGSGRFRPAVTTHSGPHLFPDVGAGRLGALLRFWPAAAVVVALGALAVAFFLWRASPRPAPEPAASSASPAAALPWEGDRFDVSIETDPVGARIQIDGHDVGFSPLPRLSLKPGSYLLRLQKDGFEPLQREVVVTSAESTHKLSFTLPAVVSTDQATLILRVVPAGALVFVDGERLAPSPSPPKLEPGTYRIEVKASGFESWSGQVDLEPGATRQLAITLSRLKATSEAETAAPASEQPVPAPEIPVVDPVRVSGDMPIYPKAALERRMKGSVLVEIEVNERGDVAGVKVLESAGNLLDQAVVSAVKTWKYQPATQAGNPVRGFVKTRHTFR